MNKNPLAITKRIQQGLLAFAVLSSSSLTFAITLDSEVLIDGSHNYARDLHSVDIDGDGDNDLVVTDFYDNAVYLYKNDGLGSMTRSPVDPSISGPQRISHGDFDNDGEIDLLITSSGDSSLSVFWNDGNENFLREVIDPSLAFGLEVIGVNLTADSYIDIAAISGTGDAVVWYKNNADSTFTKTSIASLTDPSVMVAGDIDADGDMDLVVAANSTFNTGVYAYLNNGDETFTPDTFVPVGLRGATSLQLVDLDSDGDMDFGINSAQAGRTYWYENDGLLNFSSNQLEHLSASLWFTDLDNDTDVDYLYARDNVARFHINDGTQTFPGTQIGTSVITDNISNLIATDLDGDTLPDIVITSTDNDRFSWYKNLGAPVPTPTITSTTYDYATGVFVVTGTDFTANAGGSDVDSSMFTIYSESANHTLTDTPDVEIDSPTQFTLTLSANDRIAVNSLLNRNGTLSTNGITYLFAAADDFITQVTAGDSSDTSGNQINASNIPAPTITSVDYNAPAGIFTVTASDVPLNGSGWDIDVGMFTFVGESGSTRTLSFSSDVERTSASSFSITLGTGDRNFVNALVTSSGTNANDGTAYNLIANDNWALGAIGTLDLTDNSNPVTVSTAPIPSITNATYNYSSGTLVVRGTNFKGNSAGNDVDASAITLTLEDGGSYTLTDSADVEIDNFVQFTISLSATDLVAVNSMVNSNGTTSTGGTTYNIGVADDFMTVYTEGDTSDATGNGVTVSNVAIPTLASGSYDIGTSVLSLSGADLPYISGANNDVDSSAFTFSGEGGATHTLSSTSDVDIISTTSIDITLDASDAASLLAILTENGVNAADGTPYNIAAAEDWSLGAATSSVIADSSIALTVSGLVLPTLSSSAYDLALGQLVVQGANLQANGGGADIDASMFTFVGSGGASYTLTDSTDVEIDSINQFTIDLSTADQTAVEVLLDQNGVNALDGTTYNIEAAEDWSLGVASSTTIADNTVSLTVSGLVLPSLTSSTYNLATGELIVQGTNLLPNGGGSDIDVSRLTFVGSAGATYTLTDSTDVEIDSVNQFTVSLSSTDQIGVELLLDKNGTSASDATNYELNAADDFVTSLLIGDSSDTSGNSLTVGNLAPVVLNPTSSESTISNTFTISGTHPNDGLNVFLFNDADNNGIPEGGSIASGIVSGGTWSINATLTPDTDNHFVVIADYSGINASLAIDVPVITHSTPILDTDGDTMPDAYEIANGLDPNIDDTASDFDGDGTDNITEYLSGTDPQIDDYDPIITLNSNVIIPATGLLTPVPNNLASASDGSQGNVDLTSDLSRTLLAPGRYVINWAAQDETGNTSNATQTLDVQPLANWQVDQNSSEGNTVTITLHLNGDAPSYPVVANYTIGGTAINPDDHDGVSGSLTISSGHEADISINVASDATSEADETIEVTLDSISNAVIGVKALHTVTISEFNHAPTVELSAAIDSEPLNPIAVFSTTDGPATITANVSDVDPGDSHTYAWTDTNELNGTISNGTYRFDPSSVQAGVYQLSVTATDDAFDPKSGAAAITISIVESLPTLSAANDTDGDGIDDGTEGLGDEDNDGVPDYADNTNQANLLNLYPTDSALQNEGWFMEAEAGLKIQLNLISTGTGDFSPLLSTGTLTSLNLSDETENGFSYNGGVYDFIVSNMPIAGENVFIVIPQLNAIPADASYRKYLDGEWFEFIEDANNRVYSAAGALGACPPPGSSNYQLGLSEGHYCVQIEIQDGGPNDDDGVANGIILDPGGVALEVLTSDPIVPVVPSDSSTSTKEYRFGHGGGSMNLFMLLLLCVGGLIKYRSRS